MMNQRIYIRCGVPADLNALVSFNQAMAMETESKRLSEAVLISGVRNLLESEGQGRYFIATETDADERESILGALMVTFEWSDWRNGRFWWIQSVYVDPHHRRRGIYRRLHQHVKALSEQDGACCGIRLYVEHNNTIAQQTYARVGMTKTRYDIFEEEYPNPAAPSDCRTEPCG